MRSYHPAKAPLQLGSCSILSGRSAVPSLFWWWSFHLWCSHSLCRPSHFSKLQQWHCGLHPPGPGLHSEEKDNGGALRHMLAKTTDSTRSSRWPIVVRRPPKWCVSMPNVFSIILLALDSQYLKIHSSTCRFLVVYGFIIQVHKANASVPTMKQGISVSSDGKEASGGKTMMPSMMHSFNSELLKIWQSEEDQLEPTSTQVNL